MLLPGIAEGQIPGRGVRFYLITDTLQVEPPSALRPGGLWDRLSTPQQLVQRSADGARALIERNRLFRRRRRLLAALGRSPTVAAVPGPALRPGDTTAVIAPGFRTLAQYADLNIELDARLEGQLERLRNSIVIRSLHDSTQQLASVEPVEGTGRYQLALTTFVTDYAALLQAAQSVIENAGSEDDVVAAYTSFATDFPPMVSVVRQEHAQLPAAAQQALAAVEGCGSLVSL